MRSNILAPFLCWSDLLFASLFRLVCMQPKACRQKSSNHINFSQHKRRPHLRWDTLDSIQNSIAFRLIDIKVHVCKYVYK